MKCPGITVPAFTAAAMALFVLVAFQHITGHTAIADTVAFHDAPVAEHAETVPVLILESFIGMDNSIIFIVHPHRYGKFIDKSTKFFLGYAKGC